MWELRGLCPWLQAYCFQGERSPLITSQGAFGGHLIQPLLKAGPISEWLCFRVDSDWCICDIIAWLGVLHGEEERDRYCKVVTWMLRPAEDDSCQLHYFRKSRISHVKTKWQWLLEDGFKATNHFNSGNGLTHKTIASNKSRILVRKRIYVYLYFTDYLNQLLCMKTEAVCKIGYLSLWDFMAKQKPYINKIWGFCR